MIGKNSNARKRPKVKNLIGHPSCRRPCRMTKILLSRRFGLRKSDMLILEKKKPKLGMATGFTARKFQTSYLFFLSARHDPMMSLIVPRLAAIGQNQP